MTAAVIAALLALILPAGQSAAAAELAPQHSQSASESKIRSTPTGGESESVARGVEVISHYSVDESSLEKRPTLATAEQFAHEHNPAVRQAYFAWQASSHRIVSVSSYENPMVTYSPDTQNMRVTPNGMEANGFGFSQAIPFPGKLTLRGQVADEQSHAMREQMEAVIQEVTRQVRRRYADYYLAERSLEVNAATTALVRESESIAQAMFAVGRASQQDPIQAQEEISSLAAERINLESQRVVLLGNLNALLDRPPRAPIGRPQKLGADPLTTALNQLLDSAKGMRPELLAQEHTIQASARAAALAKMGYLADFTIGGDYIGVQNQPTATGRMGNGHDLWMATIGLSIPLWLSRVKAEVNEAEANVMQEKFRRRDLGNNVNDEIQDAYERLNAAARTEAIYRATLMPQTAERIEATRADYQTGKVSFLTLIDSLKSFEAVRLMRYQAVALYQQAAGDLERAVGQAVPGVSQ